MKKIIAMLLAATMIFALCACGAPEAPAPAATAEPAEPAPAEEAAPTGSVEDQIVLLFNSVCMLKTNPDYEKYWYTVTDLDHNGRLEVIAAVTEGTGSYTSALIYEVSEDFKTLVNVDLGLKKGEFLPEIIMGKVDCYHNTDGTYGYIFFDNSNVGSGAHAQTMESIVMKDSKLTVTPLGYLDIATENGNSVYTFMDANGAPLADQAALLALAPAAFPGAIASEVSVDWFALSEIYSTERLNKSYSVFMGTEKLDVDPIITPAPLVTPEPAPTPAPTPTPVAAPVVTKHPTSESVYEGDSCQFVARADNASSMSWKLVDGRGNVYDAASSPFRGTVQVSGVNGNCLTLSNIPLGMDGYGAYAEFYGSTTVKSNPAYIYVSKRPAATASTNYSSGTCFSDLYNYITVYSTNGAKIHYECIKEGDTGPYASGEVPNGGTITIAGIDGQYINVEVYLNVVGSDKVSYYYYGVDRTPVPIYEYTEYGYVIGDNFAEIFIQTSSGVHYVPKDLCMFEGTGCPDIDDYAEIVFLNGEIYYAVIDCTGIYV